MPGAPCNEQFLHYGEWNDANSAAADIQLLCSRCYEDAIAASIDVTDEATADAWQELLADSMDALQHKQAQLIEQFDVGRHERWDYDQDSAQLIFSNNGEPAVIADMEAIGTLCTTSNTWLWAWANFSLLPAVLQRVPTVRSLGEQQGFARLTVPKWPAERADAWEMAAIACQVLHASGIYRVPSDNGYLFLAMFNVRKAQ